MAQFDSVCIPYGEYWSTSFVRWQGNFSHLHSIRFAADVARRALRERDTPPETFDTLFLDMTVIAQHSFYRAPWLAGMIGAAGISGPTINQACATSARVLASAVFEVEADTERAILVITCDKTSNGPHIYYPNLLDPGGKGESEEWVWDNFNCDPYAQNAMIETAENVAAESGISWEEQNALTLLRFQQYQDALKENGTFHRRFMVTPLDVTDPSGRKALATVTDDETHPRETIARAMCQRYVIPSEGSFSGAGLVASWRDVQKKPEQGDCLGYMTGSCHVWRSSFTVLPAQTGRKVDRFSLTLLWLERHATRPALGWPFHLGIVCGYSLIRRR